MAGFDPGWARWVLARRAIPAAPGEDPELAYYVCAGPAETTLEQLVAVAGPEGALRSVSGGQEDRRPRASCRGG